MVIIANIRSGQSLLFQTLSFIIKNNIILMIMLTLALIKN